MLRKYHESVHAYVEAVKRFTAVPYTVAKDDWELAWNQAQRALKVSEEALANIREHAAEHQC